MDRTFLLRKRAITTFLSRKRAITTFLSQKFMITRSSIPFEDFLGSSIAPQVMPPWCQVVPFLSFSSLRADFCQLLARWTGRPPSSSSLHIFSNFLTASVITWWRTVSGYPLLFSFIAQAVMTLLLTQASSPLEQFRSLLNPSSTSTLILIFLL